MIKLNNIKEIVCINGVSGREGEVARKLQSLIAPYTDESYIDALGNLIALKRGSGEKKEKIMLCAHMDEIGFIVTFIEESGMIRIAPIGGINFVAAAFCEVEFENGVVGVLVPETGVAASAYTFDKFYVDIGATSQKEAEHKVKIGDCLTLKHRVTKLQGSRIAGRPLDDRIGCFVMLEIAERLAEVEVNDDVYYVFSVQEEVGLRGSKPSSFAVAPDVAIAFDVTGTGDSIGAKPMAVKVGGGAAIKIKDSSVICHTGLVEELISTAKTERILYQTEILTYGGTDTSSMQSAGCGSKAGAISIPTRYIHSGVELIDLKDVEATVKLCTAYIARK